MKLATLAAYIWSGWPKGVVALEQTASGHLIGTYTTTRKKEMRKDPLPLCEDWSSSVVTQADYNIAVSASLRMGAEPSVDYFPVCRVSQIPEEITSSLHYEQALDQSNYLLNSSREALIAQIAYLHMEMELVLGIHLTTLRQRRKLAVQVVPQDQTLAWQLGRNLPVWPSMQWGSNTYAAKFVSQNEDGKLIAHMEYNDKLYAVEITTPYAEFGLAADALNTDGTPKLINRKQWESAQKARIEKSNAHTAKFEDALQATSHAGIPAPGTPGFAAYMEELARGAKERNPDIFKEEDK